jgi:hypothetical protein
MRPPLWISRTTCGCINCPLLASGVAETAICSGVTAMPCP